MPVQFHDVSVSCLLGAKGRSSSLACFSFSVLSCADFTDFKQCEDAQFLPGTVDLHVRWCTPERWHRWRLRSCEALHNLCRRDLSSDVLKATGVLTLSRLKERETEDEELEDGEQRYSKCTS